MQNLQEANPEALLLQPRVRARFEVKAMAGEGAAA